MDEWALGGYHLRSLSLYGTPAAPLYAGIVTKLEKTAQPAMRANHSGESGRIYAKVEGGKLTCDAQAPTDPDAKAGLAAIAAELASGPVAAPETFGALAPEEAHTLGTRGGEARVHRIE